MRRLGIALGSLVGAVVAYALFGGIGFGAWLLLVVLALAAVEGFGSEEGRRGFWIALTLPLSLLLWFVAERVVGDGHEHQWAWRLLAGVGLAAVIGWRARELTRSGEKQRRVETRLAAALGGVVLAVIFYALSTDAGVEWLGLEGAAAARTAGALGVLWIAVLVVSLGALWFMEMAYRRMPVEEAIELRRVSSAAGNGLTLALSLVFVASINYVASERDEKWDLSYLKTTRPSETSRSMVQRLDEPVRVVLLYPRVNEVLERLRPYFDELAAASDQLTVEVRDHALAPELVEQHRVSGNGYVLMVRGEGEQAEAQSFEVGTELDRARRPLRTLDGRFQEHFAALTVRPRALHMTTGHRERSPGRETGDPEPQRIAELAALLRRSNVEKRDLGIAQGLADRVPEGARAVAVIGPREPFLPEEAESLRRYVAEGGRLIVFVDPDADHGLNPLLHALGLELSEGVLHSEAAHLRGEEPPADRALVYTNEYVPHPVVTNANRGRARGASVFAGGGALRRYQGDDALEGIDVTFPVRTPATFWLDRDGDHERDEGEPTGERFTPMAVVTVPAGDAEGRAVVIADGDFIVDRWIQLARTPSAYVVQNAIVLLDSLNWLVGEDQVLGPTTTEEDVEIRHTRDQDELWFYATTFGAPIPLLAMGVWLAVRGRRGGGRRHTSRPKPTRTADPAPPAAPVEERAARTRDEEEE